MKRSPVLFRVFVLLLISLSPAAVAAQADPNDDAAKETVVNLIRRMQDLEKEVSALRAQLSELKQQTAVATASPMPAATPGAASNQLTELLGSTTLSGLVDTYYSYDFNHPQPQTSALRAFDGPSNQFALNLIELNLDRPPDPTNSRLGFRLGVGYGQAMNVVNNTEPAGLAFAQSLKEGYVSYLAPVGKGLQVDVGKFVTPHGAEVIETKDNWNYSRGLLFTYAIPFYHFGARARYTFSSKYSLAGFLVNGWNDIFDNNTGKTFGVTLGWNPTPKVTISQGYMAGPETTGANAHWRQLSDTVVTYSPIAKLSATVNFDYARGDRIAGALRPVFWTGIAGYLRYQVDSRYALAARYEYYDDHYGFTTGTPQQVQEFTGTLQRLLAHHLITRLEYRHDLSNRPVFTKGTRPVLRQSTLTAGMVYSFDIRESK